MINVVTLVTAIAVAFFTLILQKSFSNFLSGIFLKITKPFKKGDKVVIRNGNNGNDVASGVVLKSGLLHTKIKAYNKDVYILNNGYLDNCIVINSDYTEGINHTDSIKVSLDSNLAKVSCIIYATLTKHDKTNNTMDNTHIIFRYENGGVLVQYNVRTDDIATSYDVCSEIAKHLITTFNNTDDITLM